MKMELSDKAANLLHSAFLSYTCAIGEPFNELFKTVPEYKEIFDMLEQKLFKEDHIISEMSPILRKGDPGIKRKIQPETHRNVAKRLRNMTGKKVDRLVADKTARRGGKLNDPHLPKAKISEQLRKCIFFLRDNINKSSIELKKLVEEFPYKQQLFQLVDHMIATRLAGWRKNDEKYLVNESGHIASIENWDLLNNGRIKPKNGSVTTYDLSLLLDIREVCHA